MKTTFLPFYLSRAILSAVFTFGSMGFSIVAAAWALGLFGLCVFYLHSGWFSVDKSRPFTPMRRDQFALEVQRKSIIAAVLIALLFHYLQPHFPGIISHFSILDMNAIGVGVAIYFIAQFSQFLIPRLKPRSA
jgi:O-antigen/teichoic acid export membrane protein